MTTTTSTEKTDWTIGRLLSWTTDYLRKHDIDEPRLAAEVLLAHAAGCRRIDLYTRFDGTLNGEQTGRFRDWIRRAAASEPIAYLVGHREFFSLSFLVTPDVLIPRPETELLVEFVIDHCTRTGLNHPRILDVGTGSGCIAVSLLTHLRTATVIATDLSTQAIEVASRNAQRHGVAERVTLLAADRLAVPPDCVPPGGFDVLVCNPPYIPLDGMEHLASCIRDFEPRMALTDGGDGLSFYRSMAADAPRLLAQAGIVAMEVGDGQAPEAISTMLSSGGFRHRATAKDRVVGKERVIAFTRVAGE